MAGRRLPPEFDVDILNAKEFNFEFFLFTVSFVSKLSASFWPMSEKYSFRQFALSTISVRIDPFQSSSGAIGFLLLFPCNFLTTFQKSLLLLDWAH